MKEPLKRDAIQGDIIHEYDGIQEADNRLPSWWLLTFAGAIVFSIGYWFYYQEFKVGLSPTQHYYAAMAAIAEKTGADPTDEELRALADGPSLALGQQLFAANCVACHEAKGQGKIGPNLTDAAWLHGGTPLAIFKTLRDGVTARGMPAWGATLGRAGVSQLTAFVLSLQGTNVPGKAPEGQVEAAAPAEPTAPAEPAAADAPAKPAAADAPAEPATHARSAPSP